MSHQVMDWAVSEAAWKVMTHKEAIRLVNEWRDMLDILPSRRRAPKSLAGQLVKEAQHLALGLSLALPRLCWAWLARAAQGAEACDGFIGSLAAPVAERALRRVGRVLAGAVVPEQVLTLHVDAAKVRARDGRGPAVVIAHGSSWQRPNREVDAVSRGGPIVERQRLRIHEPLCPCLEDKK